MSGGEQTGYVPRAMRITAERMSSFARNRFRLETVSASRARPGNIITVNLPENSLLHMRSFKMHARVEAAFARESSAAADNAAGLKAIYSKLPEDPSDLISRVEVYLNGVQVQQGTQEYNTICKVLNLSRDNSARRTTASRSAAGKSYVNQLCCPDDHTLTWADWKGFLGEASTEYIPTDLLGQIQIRITLAGPEVLSRIAGKVPASDGKDYRVRVDPNMVTELSLDAEANSDYTSLLATFQPSFELADMYFTIDSVQMDSMYGDMLRQKMSSSGYIPILFKEYYAFQSSNQTGTSLNMRFSLSSGSVDALYSIMRKSSYASTKQPAVAYEAKSKTEVTLTENKAFRPGYFCFKSCDATLAASTDPLRENLNYVDGTLRYHFTVNNVRHPQWAAPVSNAIFDVAYAVDKFRMEHPGNLLFSREDFHNVNGVYTCCLSVPGERYGVRSGYDSRGISSQFTFDSINMKPPDGNTSYSGMMIAECTQELRVAAGKNVAVSH